MWKHYWEQGHPTKAFYEHLDQIKAHGASVIRVDFGWSASQETNSPPSEQQWYNRRLDTVLRAAEARKLRTLLTIHQSPAWARPGTGDNVRQFPADPAAIGPWATWMSRTYGSRVYAWEIWNEPDLFVFTGLKDKAERIDRYVALLKVAHGAIKSGYPQARVVFGGPSQTDAQFIRDAYARGAKTYFDILAMHPYQGDQTKDPWSDDVYNQGRMTYFPEVVKVMRDYDDLSKPVWWTEFGFSVHSNEGIQEPWRKGVPDERTAGRYLEAAFELARQRYPQVRLGIVYTAYRPDNGDPHQRGFRMLDENSAVLPQLPMLADYFARFPTTRQSSNL